MTATGVSDDPVAWKKLADLYLSSSAEVGDLYQQQTDEAQMLNQEIGRLEGELARARTEAPKLDEEVGRQVAEVQAIQREIYQTEVSVTEARAKALQHEKEVQVEQQKLEEMMEKLEDHQRKQFMLEQRMEEQRRELVVKLEALATETAAVKTKSRLYFKAVDACR